MKKTGFTLLEVLIASVIFALVVTSLVSIFVVSRQYLYHSRSRMSATQLIKAFFAPLQYQVRQDQWLSNCLSTGICNNPSETLDGIVYNATYNITNVTDTTLRRVSLTINWTE